MIARLFAPMAMKVVGGIIAALLAFVALLLIQIHGLPIIGGGLIARLDRMTALNNANVASHRTTKRNYAQAMADARRNEALRLARVKAEQERINDDRKAAANARLDALRARYDSLRTQARTGVAGSAGGQPVPSLPAPAFGADAATGADGLSAAGLTLAERYECSVSATQLDELITWVEAQTLVRVNN